MDAWGGGAGIGARSWRGFKEFCSRRGLRPREEEEGRRMSMKTLQWFIFESIQSA